MYPNYTEFNDIIAKLGFSSNDDMIAEARIKLIHTYEPNTYLAEGRDASVEAWQTYRELAEDRAGTAAAQIGLILDTAVFWAEVGDPIKFQLELLDAHTYARNLGLDDIASTIEHHLDTVLQDGLELLLIDEYEEAIKLFIALENRPNLTGTEHGYIMLALAYAYKQLYFLAANGAKLHDILAHTIGTAMAYLDGMPDQASAIRSLAHLSE